MRKRTRTSCGSRSRRALLPGLLAAVGLLAVWFAAGTASAASRAAPLTLYSIATGEQYVDNADDRARGKGNNPFGNFKDTSATIKQGAPPYPGDEALFSFGVYASGSLKKPVGSAVFTCVYNFARNAICDAAYRLGGGIVFGTGAFNYDADGFVIAITGGTGKYVGITGDVDVTPGPHHSQRLVFASP